MSTIDPARGISPDSDRQTFVGNLQIAAFVVVVVTIECAIAWMFIPSTGDIAALAAEQVKQEQAAAEETTTAKEPLTTEVDLGKFAVTATQPVTNTILRISFSLWGTVPQEQSAEFQQVYERNKNRLRQEVILIARQIDAEGLADPNLSLLKRKILERLNQVLGKPLVQSVVFSDFSYVDQ